MDATNLFLRKECYPDVIWLRTKANSVLPIVKLIARMPMLTWLSLVLLSSAWSRPAEQTVRIWVISIPALLLLDVLRTKWSPERQALRAWFTLASVAEQRGGRPEWMPGYVQRLSTCYGPIALLVAYLTAFLFIPSARAVAASLDGTPIMEWLYSVVTAWYPMIAREHAAMIALGLPREASELRHYLTVALLLSLGWTFVASGPGRPELALRWFRLRRPFKVAVIQIFIGDIMLTMFSGFGYGGDPRIHLELTTFVPCGMLAIGACNLGWGIASVGFHAGLLLQGSAERHCADPQFR